MANVISESIDVPAGDGVADAFVARPSGGEQHPAVILYMDAYGLRPAVEAHAQKLAARGYFVFVPNLFYRSGRSPVAENIVELISAEDRAPLFAMLRPKMALLTPEALNADSKAWLAFLRGRSEAGDGAIGTTGYCLGGRVSLRMAGEFPDDVGAAASFHGGGLATDADDSPHLAAVHARAELYVGHADNDGSMPPEQMGRLSAVLGEAHVRNTTELYVGAQHGWTQTDTPAYDQPSAERAWARLFDLLDRTLGT